MNESFLHYLWQHQYFDHQELGTTDGRKLTIHFPGFHNSNSGPDFFQCRIRIGDIEWIGAVEIHLKSSHFLVHQHLHDPAYRIVVLHVVWENDQDITLPDGFTLPVLELHGRVPEQLIQTYGHLIFREEPIVCGSALSTVSPTAIWSMIGQAAARRMEQKTKEVSDFLMENNYTWQEVTYRLMARSFGLKVNAQAFLRLAELLPFKKISRLRGDRFRMESALFGVAGFLEEDLQDDYHSALKREFDSIRKILRLSVVMNKVEWKFLRMRPRNFPTIRLAQFAAFLDAAGDMLSVPTDQELLDRFRSLPAIGTSTYWQTHYRFGVSAKDPFEPVLGKKFIDHCLVNLWTPICLSRAAYLREPGVKEWALSVLQSIPPESNLILRKWKEWGILPANAFESQGLLFQYQHYCSRKKCLECEVGLDLLGRSVAC